MRRLLSIPLCKKRRKPECGRNHSQQIILCLQMYFKRRAPFHCWCRSWRNHTRNTFCPKKKDITHKRRSGMFIWGASVRPDLGETWINEGGERARLAGPPVCCSITQSGLCLIKQFPCQSYFKYQRHRVRVLGWT